VGSEIQDLVVTPDGKRLYVADVFANAVSVIDTATNHVLLPVLRKCPCFVLSFANVSGGNVSPNSRTFEYGTLDSDLIHFSHET
jgi:YVTN family beta-propeller protein